MIPQDEVNPSFFRKPLWSHDLFINEMINAQEYFYRCCLVFCAFTTSSGKTLCTVHHSRNEGRIPDQHFFTSSSLFAWDADLGIGLRQQLLYCRGNSLSLELQESRPLCIDWDLDLSRFGSLASRKHSWCSTEIKLRFGLKIDLMVFISWLGFETILAVKTVGAVVRVLGSWAIHPFYSL